MIRAYNEAYLYKAQTTLAVFLDYSVNIKNNSLDSTFNKFISSGVANLFEKGHPSYTAGMSGIELYNVVFGDFSTVQTSQDLLNRSAEYWLGHSLAFYQWYTNQSYKSILSLITPSELMAFYPIHHEMDIMNFVDMLNRRINIESRIQLLRKQSNLSQEDLSKLSGVNVRTIRSYESSPSVLQKAQYDNLYKISKALNCSVDNLMRQETIPYNFYGKDTIKNQFEQDMLIRLQNNNKKLQELELQKAELENIRTSTQLKFIKHFNNQNLLSINNSAYINEDNFLTDWSNYWQKYTNSKIQNDPSSELMALIKRLGKEALGEVIKKIDPTAGTVYNGLRIISANDLVDAVAGVLSIIDTYTNKE